MKKSIFLLSVLVTGMILVAFSGCKKQDGSALLTIYWKKPFDDSCIVHGIDSADFFVNNDYQGQLGVGMHYWNTPISCNEHGSITYSQKNDNVSPPVAVRVVLGAVKIINEDIRLEEGQCKVYELHW